jgi:hypothetical protein
MHPATTLARKRDMTKTFALAVVVAGLLRSASVAHAQPSFSCDDVPGGATFASLDCRRSALGARLGVTPPEQLRRHLIAAGSAEARAATACRKAKSARARRHLARAVRTLGRLTKKLRGRAARRTLGADRAILLADVIALRTDLRALRKTLRCPENAPPLCGDGRVDPIERCDRFEGAPAAPLVATTADLDLETGSPDAEVDVDPNGGRLVRTRLEIGFAPAATVADGNRVLDAAGARLVMTLDDVPLVLVRIPDPGSVAALDAVMASIAADAAVTSVTRAYLDATDVLPDNFAARAASAPAASALELRTIDNHLAVRAPAAWNARRAIQASRQPTVIVADKFGDGPPDAAVAASFPNPSDFDRTNFEFHGYHVTGILAGSFGGARRCDTAALGNGASGDAAGRDCVTGMMPAPVTMRAIDLQLGNLTRPAKEDKLIQMVKSLGGNVIVNESLGLGFAPTPEELATIAIGWTTKVRGGLFSNGTVGAGVENRVLHVTSAGNSGNAALAQVNSAPNAAALLPGLTQVVPIPNLTNVLAIENVINTASSFVGVACLNAASSRNGHLSAPGTSVWSLLGPSVGVADLSGTSQAAPQVAGLATYLWSLAPELTPQQLAALLRVTAVRPVTGDPPVSETCGAAIPAPTIDAYEAVLSVDAAELPTPASAPVRTAILDVNDDGDFDEDDLAEYVGALIDPATGTPREQEEADYGRFDLNGDGFTGRPGGLVLGTPDPTRFDLDRVGSQRFGVAAFGPDLVSQVIEDVPVPFDELAVSDLAVLCYYAHSDLYTGDPEDRRTLLEPDRHCFRIAVDATLPATIEADASASLNVVVTVVGPDGAEASAPGFVVELTPRDADATPESGTTDDDGELTAEITPLPDVTSIAVDVVVRATQEGPVLAQTTVTATVGVESLEQLEVPTNGATGTSQTVLAAGVTYTLRASGTFRIGGPGDGLADADFADFSNPPSSLLDRCNGTGVDFGISVNGIKLAWGAFSATHVYELPFVGTGAPITVGYDDCNFGDNSGSLGLEILGPAS